MTVYVPCLFGVWANIYAEHIIGNIKHNIESNLMRNDTVSHLAATHEMAFSAVCEMPKNTNSSQWNEDNTWNLFFRLPHNKQYNSVSSAVLRLYMNGINSTGARNQRESGNCKNPSEQMIRITVSVYFRKNRRDNAPPERKKRICSSTTITQSYRGWITMDTLLAVKLWDKPNRNLGIAIDVEDQEDRPLRAADFFQPADCSEASKTNASTVFPWSFFGSSLARTINEMDDVPHYPRIDISFQQNMHHSHRLHRPKYHHGYGARSHLVNRSTAGSYSGNSYEHEDADSKGHQSEVSPSTNTHNYHRAYHMHHIFHKLHTHLRPAASSSSAAAAVHQPVVIKRTQMTRRHLHDRTVAATNDDFEENQSVSSSAMHDSTAVTSGEERNL
uniref:TGF-beta propeptide domain-containing protein n=1 Tax=Anopheles culicifacies TaxID=139723 RepID=A0A182M875_9DIPT